MLEKLSLNYGYHLLISRIPRVGFPMKFREDDGLDVPSFRNIQPFFGPQQSSFVYLILSLLFKQHVFLNLSEDLNIEAVNSTCRSDPTMNI